MSNGHEYILVVIDYFTKWVKAASYSVLIAKHVARFIKYNIIFRFVVPQEIILDNGSHFEGEVQSIMELYHVEHHKSSLCWPQTNGSIEAANKNIKNILAKMVVTYKDWVKKPPFAFWGYWTFIHASIGATPYSLVYGSKAVLPIEVKIQSLRVLVEMKVLEEDWMKEMCEHILERCEQIWRTLKVEIWNFLESFRFVTTIRSHQHNGSHQVWSKHIRI